MQVPQSHVHYAPSSVGALMDPGFLRGAVLDAESESHHWESATSQGLSARFCAVLRIAVSGILAATRKN